MEQSVEEIAETFEIVDKKECTSDCASTSDSSSVKNEIHDDESNNNSMIETTPATTNDSNNNQSTPLHKIRKFSRDELIKLKQSMAPATAAIKENVLGSIFKENPLDRTLDRNRRDAVDKMMPSFNRSRSYQKQSSVDHPSGRRSQQGGRNNSSQNMIQKRLISNEDIKLNTAENAWKPTALVKDSDQPEVEAKTAELLKQFRSILNKLTPENFSTLIQNLKQLTIDTVDLLDECISLVFEKAIHEPNYSANYAQLCKEVSIVFVVPLDEKNSEQKAVFKNRLITQCQKEFEKHRNNDLAKSNADRLKEIEDEIDPVKKEELKADLEFEHTKIRRRAVGTVHFIGELYKIEMLTSKIMNSCISHLLDPSMCSEETLECLCKLLTTIGKRLEKLDAKKVDLSECFATLTKLADKKNPIGISSRIRFMIQDLIELRLNNWTPRPLQREIKPQTMHQIKKQAEMEQYSNKMDIRENENRNNRGGFGSANKPRGGNGNVDGDGWNVVTSVYTKKAISFDAKKLSSLSQTSDNITLGGGVPSFQNFSNRFAGLQEEASTGADQSSSSNNNNNNNRSYQGRFSGGGQNMNNNNRNSYDRSNRKSSNRSAGSRSLQPMGGMNDSSNQKQFPSRKISYQTPSRPNDLPKANTLPRKISAPARPMTERRMENLIDDPVQVSDSMKKLVNSYQCEEMTLAEVIEKLHKYRIEKDALVSVYNWSFDQKEKERFHLTELICESVSHDIISTRDLVNALQEILEIAVDLVCDLPHVYCYFGQLLALPLLKRIVQVRDLLKMSKNQIEVNNGATVIKNIFKVFEQKYEKKALMQLYNESGTDFQLFLDTDTQLNDFLKENNFEYLKSQETKDEKPTMILDESTIQEMKTKLANPDNDPDSMILWVKNHIKDPTDVGFIRSMSALIFENCLEKTLEGYRVNKSRLEKASLLLSQFLDGNAAREINCLYAFNVKINELEHPVGCAQEILTCLYDNFAVSKKGFLTWKDDNNPKEQEGKGVTLKSCTHFIEYLQKDESSGEEN